MILGIFVQYLFLILPLLIHVLHDVPEINGGHSPNHPRMALIVLVVACLSGYFLYPMFRVEFWRFALFSLAIHFSFFNYILNYFRKPREPFFYIGNGFWDRLLKPFPPVVRLAIQIGVIILGGWIYYNK